MKLHSLNDLLKHELEDLLSAEQQLVEALPMMAAAATAPELRQGFEKHLQETRTQLQRVDQALLTIGHKPNDGTCKGMHGLIEEGSDLMKHVERGSVLDAALIDAGRKVERYEITAYRGALARAHELGHPTVARLLEMNLQEEELADRRLQQLSQGMMPFSGPGSDPRDDDSEAIIRQG